MVWRARRVQRALGWFWGAGAVFWLLFVVVGGCQPRCNTDEPNCSKNSTPLPIFAAEADLAGGVVDIAFSQIGWAGFVMTSYLLITVVLARSHQDPWREYLVIRRE